MDSQSSDIQSRARHHLHQMFNVPQEKIQSEALLQADLDLDSIDTIDLLSKLNDEFHLDLSPFDFEGCQTLGQFMERLNRCQKK